MNDALTFVSFEAVPGSAGVPAAELGDAGTVDALRAFLAAPSPSVSDALGLARLLGSTGVRPGVGRTQYLWQLLATIGAHDLGAVRAIEPHLDALAILAEAAEHDSGEGHENPDALGDPGSSDTAWGVFASESGGGPHGLVARQNEDGTGSVVLSGTKSWCSLADRLGAALVTATLPGGERQLFAVDLTQSGVRVEPNAWFARGLTEITSGPVHFDAVPATPVGAPGWYLERPGFSWGGIGVAACWYGGAVGVARTLFAAAGARSPDPILLMHVGAVDAQLADCRRALREAAALVDGGAATGDDGRLLALRVRATVARASEAVLQDVAHALGPAPLALDEQHAKRVADLELYLRQHHAEKDDAALGAELVARAELPW